MTKVKRLGRPLTKIHPRNMPVCLICGVVKKRRILPSGMLETPYLVMRRKTCGSETDCYIQLISGERNWNYKGYLPKCIICKTKIGYNSAEDMKNGKIPKYCGKCWLEKMIKEKKGIYPKHLKPFSFKKGTNNLLSHKQNCNCFIHRKKGNGFVSQ